MKLNMGRRLERLPNYLLLKAPEPSNQASIKYVHSEKN